MSKPFLNWAGKAERHAISVPTVPLFVHERHSTKAILETIKHRKASGEQLDLFGDQPMDIADRLDAYEHKGPWANRMILGDSLQVMNSLLEYEGLGGQVQMVYMDPPYGVKFGSSFQPFVRKRDVKHGADDHMIREPEMVKAYRDTWELVENNKKLRISCSYVTVTPGVLMSDLLKTTRSSEIFSVTGLPDVDIRETGETNAAGDKLYITELKFHRF